MVVFTGIHVAVCDVDPALVFEAATQPELLSRWTIGQFENVRVEGSAPFVKGSRFLADEVLAEGAGEMDHLYEVIEYEPARAFALRCIDGPQYVGELKLQAQDGQTQISWIYSAAPSMLFDRLMCILLYAKTRRDTQRHAEREVGKLVAIAKDLNKPEANERARPKKIDDQKNTHPTQVKIKPTMLDRFTDHSRRLFVLAKEEAEALNHQYVGSEHILLGLLCEDVGVGSKALEALGITHDPILSKVVEIVGEGQPPPLEFIPFAPSARRVLELSLDEAGRLGHGYIGTESILLALTAERDGAAAQVLVQLGVDLDRVRSLITDLLTGVHRATDDPAACDSAAAETGADFDRLTFEKFTDQARRVVVLAQDEARALNHSYIGTEHILLGLIHEGEGVAGKALESLRISLEAARRQVEAIIGQGQQAHSGHLPFTPRAKKVLELSLQEASELGRGYAGTEHILLGLIREGHGVAAQVLIQLGADADQARQQVIQLLTTYRVQHLSSPDRAIAELDQPCHADAAVSDRATTVADIVDNEAKQLLDDAVQEAQDAGDRALGGQHVLLATCLRDNSGWLALRWAGAAPRPLIKAALQATSNSSPHKESVPLSRELRQALDDGWRALGQPLSAAALLASLIRNQEPGMMQTVVGAGLLPQDVLAAVAALARIGEVDAAAGRLATIGYAAEPARPRPPPDSGTAARQTEDHRAQRQGKALPEARGWVGPNREAAMSMFQFQVAAVSAMYLLLLVSTLIALVVAATQGRLWLLVLAPLAGLGNPRLGTWSLVPAAVLFWWLHLPVISTLVMVSIPLDATMGALMLQRNNLAECLPENRGDLRIGVQHVVRAVGLGAGTGK